MIYKVLNENGTARYSGAEWAPCGEWMPRLDGELIACQYGYHLCHDADLVHWLGPVIYEAEYRGEFLQSDTKLVCREARRVRRIETWNERIARLFTADCAEHVLPIWERRYPEDRRPRESIAAARALARGEITAADAADAAYAAYAAARAADATDAAYAVDAAAYAAYAVDAAAYAAYATDAAAYAAYAIDAAAYAAYAAYATDAARAAARAAHAADAARAAAYAADAADAARATARAVDAANAADAAARAVERHWQTTRLLQYLRGEVS